LTKTPNTCAKKTALFRGKVAAANITDNARQRNPIALQSALLSAAALGIGSILLLTGNHQRFGNDPPQAMGVFDLDSISLLALARRMRDNGEVFSRQKISASLCLLEAAANLKREPIGLQVLLLQKWKLDPLQSDTSEEKGQTRCLRRAKKLLPY
jgi:methylenetetrahydrofolate reductase (NADPH)